MEKRIGTLWTYDKAVNYRHNALDIAVNDYNAVSKTLEEGIQINLPLSLAVEVRKRLLKEATEKIMQLKDYCKIRVDSSKLLLKTVKKARPILMGPATLDTLLHNKPDTYDYVKNEHLPFKNMFFEFLEPAKLGIPFQAKQENIVGIHFYVSTIACYDPTDEQKYFAEIYYQSKGKLRSMLMTCNPASMAGFQGSLRNVSFHINMNSKEVNYTLDKDREIDIRNGSIPDGIAKYFRSASLGDIENNSFFVTVANLCTNIINYINADNKIIMEKTRDVQVKTTNNNSRRKTKVEKKEEPYSLIKIKPVRYSGEYKPTGNMWELTERICVRGHDRKYRHDNGDIKRVIWINDFVKGPQDAPFKDQRHALHYKKIQREKKMMQTGQRFQ